MHDATLVKDCGPATWNWIYFMLPLVKRPHLHQSMAQGFCNEMVCMFFWFLQQHQDEIDLDDTSEEIQSIDEKINPGFLD